MFQFMLKSFVNFALGDLANWSGFDLKYVFQNVENMNIPGTLRFISCSSLEGLRMRFFVKCVEIANLECMVILL
jgi:hypothetical protein